MIKASTGACPFDISNYIYVFQEEVATLANDTIALQKQAWVKL